MKNFFLLSLISRKGGFRITSWNFWSSGHGKGTLDGVGAAVKRPADSLVAHGRDMPNARLVFEEPSQIRSAVKLFFVAEREIARYDALLPKAFPVSRHNDTAPGELQWGTR